jgi:hypothetical protein
MLTLCPNIDTLPFESMNGTMVLVPRGYEDEIDVQGKIALISLRLPHERAIRNLQNRGAVAVVMGGFTGRWSKSITSVKRV